MSIATYNAKELGELLGCSQGMSYKLIRQMNEELKAKGYMTLRGKVSREYVKLRFFGGNIETKESLNE